MSPLKDSFGWCHSRLTPSKILARFFTFLMSFFSQEGKLLTFHHSRAVFQRYTWALVSCCSHNAIFCLFWKYSVNTKPFPVLTMLFHPPKFSQATSFGGRELFVRRENTMSLDIYPSPGHLHLVYTRVWLHVICSELIKMNQQEETSIRLLKLFWLSVLSGSG